MSTLTRLPVVSHCICSNFAAMFKRLQQKWKLSGWQLFWVLCTFALGGSLCGFIGRTVITPLAIENGFLYGTVYFIILTITWPLCVLAVSIPFGQFNFFRSYLRKIASRFGIIRSAESAANRRPANLAIFASGTGSNARRLMEHFAGHPLGRVVLLACNKPGAGALHHAAEFGISTLMLEKKRFSEGDGYLEELRAAGIDHIILAGFLWKMPQSLLAAFPNKIVNIHPALLPKFGGKGMYGKHVHEAVLAGGEQESGITIHLVDEHYDHGPRLLQVKCPVLPEDTADTLAARVHQLEHLHYPVAVEEWLKEAGKNG
jgi:formyltetrahydrofolate-dependent phosphoribosylglycinamide formyltransferase